MKVTLVIECTGQNLSSQIIGQKTHVEFMDGTKLKGYLTEAQVEHDPYPSNYWSGLMTADSYYKALGIDKIAPESFSFAITPSEVSQADTMTVLGEAIPGISETLATCPSCGGGDHLTSIIVHLNDQHHWPREMIADWLEQAGLALPITLEGNE